MSNDLSTLWLIFATVMVLSMQAGFLMLEGGRVRAKNSINVAQKNVTDLIVVWVVFFICGCYLMFGVWIAELPEPKSSVSPAANNAISPLHFMYQLAFCTTAATIVSGAIAERFSYRAYLLVVMLIGAFIYPVVGRMVWGNAYSSEVTAYLANLGFIDFAGSTVVHSVGAWVALVAVIMVGPRAGRFDDQGNPLTMPAFNSVISLCGVFILFLGWLGFNAGSLSPDDPRLPFVLFHTITAGAFGGCAGMAIGCLIDKGVFNPSRVSTGILGGLVACTASVIYVNTMEAIAIGLIGGTVATVGADLLLKKFKIDDPLDCIATHGLAGVFGTLAVAFVMPIEQVASLSRLTQLAVQSAGVLLVFVFTTFVSFVALKIINRFIAIRVSDDAEKLGLNYTEHGETVSLDRLKNTMENKLASGLSFSGGLAVNNDDEHSELAATLNKVIFRYENASKELKQARERFQHFAETASDWLWESDTQLNVQFVHKNIQQQNGDADINLLIGAKLTEIISFSQQDLDALKISAEQGSPTPIIETHLTNSGHTNDGLAVSFRAMPYFDSDGSMIGFRGTLCNISTRKSAEQKALYLSLHDELTGLANRRALSQAVSESIERAQLSNSCLIVAGLDLDGFKAINDTYGHDIGDALLIEVSMRLRRFLRPVDVAYRTGGDEFVVLFDSLDTNEAINMARSVSIRLIADISEAYDIQGLRMHIGASIGLSCFPNDTNNAQDLLRMADLALYSAKQSGKGRVTVYTAEHDKDAEFQRQMEQDLRRAIKNDEFYLMYQPQVDTITEQITGYEALLRWNHPENGIVSPADFIPVAEKLNLMDDIGRFVLNKAISFASTWPLNDEGLLPRLSVNVSPKQIVNPTFVPQVVDILNEHSVEPQSLELELTEDTLIDNFERVTDVLNQLRNLGIAIAVDDFGSGQTSLRYLNQLPLSTLKIDRNFISHLGLSQRSSEITRTIVMLGQTLGINVVAEGVEEKAQLDLLRQWNCDQIQGFLFARPMSVEDVSLLMQNNKQPTLRNTG